MLTYSFLWEVRINPCKHSVLFVGHRQTVQTQIRDNAASDRGLHCLLTECYNKFKQKRKIPPNTPKLEIGNGLVR